MSSSWQSPIYYGKGLEEYSIQLSEVTSNLAESASLKVESKFLNPKPSLTVAVGMLMGWVGLALFRLKLKLKLSSINKWDKKKCVNYKKI